MQTTFPVHQKQPTASPETSPVSWRIAWISKWISKASKLSQLGCTRSLSRGTLYGFVSSSQIRMGKDQLKNDTFLVTMIEDFMLKGIIKEQQLAILPCMRHIRNPQSRALFLWTCWNREPGCRVRPKRQHCFLSQYPEIEMKVRTLFHKSHQHGIPTNENHE